MRCHPGGAPTPPFWRTRRASKCACQRGGRTARVFAGPQEQHAVLDRGLRAAGAQGSAGRQGAQAAAVPWGRRGVRRGSRKQAHHGERAPWPACLPACVPCTALTRVLSLLWPPGESLWRHNPRRGAARACPGSQTHPMWTPPPRSLCPDWPACCSPLQTQAAQSGANLIGLILWPRSKRSVTDPAVARAIADAARQGGAEPVGVFVDEDAATVSCRPPSPRARARSRCVYNRAPPLCAQS